MDRILAAAAEGSPHGLTRALFESLREFPTVRRATLWKAGGHGSPWRHVRTLGAPTPAPEEISGPSWCAPGFEVLPAGPLGSLVIESALGKGNEEALFGIECLLTMCSSLASLEPDGPHPALEDVRSALPSDPPAPGPAVPQGQLAPDGDRLGDGGQSEARSELPSEPQSNPPASRPEPQDLPNPGDAAA